MTADSNAPRSSQRLPSETLWTAWSVFLSVHCIIVLLCVTANYMPSLLQERLLFLIRPYAQPLHLDWNSTPFYLTHGTVLDMDHYVEYRHAQDEPWHPLVESVPWACEATARYFRWSRFLALHVDDEADEVAARMTVAAARFVQRKTGRLPERLRLRRHESRSWETAAGLDSTQPSDPHDERYRVTVYEVAVELDPSGDIRVVPLNPLVRPAFPEAVR